MKSLSVSDKEYICDLQAPCFQILPPDELELIRASKTQVLFKKGDNLTKQGTFSSYVLFIVEGLAIQYIESDTFKNFNLRIIKPGEFIGMFSLFSKKTFNYSSLALTDCHAFLVEKDAITKVMNENGAFGLGLIQRYSEQNVNLFDSIRNVLFKQMNGRFADVLLYLDSLKPEYPAIFQLLSRKDIADFAGISHESAVKLLKALEKDGCLELNTKDIVITDYVKLQEISKVG